MILLTYTWGNPILFWSQQINLHKITTLSLPHDSLPQCSHLHLYFITVIQQEVFQVLPLVGQQLRLIGLSTKHDQLGNGPSRLLIALQKYCFFIIHLIAGMQSANVQTIVFVCVCDAYVLNIPCLILTRKSQTQLFTVSNSKTDFQSLFSLSFKICLRPVIINSVR